MTKTDKIYRVRYMWGEEKIIDWYDYEEVLQALTLLKHNRISQLNISIKKPKSAVTETSN